MEETIFKVAQAPIKVFKSIRIRKLFYDERGKTKEVVGHLNYLRHLSKDYKWKPGDDLDLLILRAAENAFIDARLVFNSPLMLENQLKDFKFLTRGNVRQKVRMTFFPDIDFDAAGLRDGEVIKAYSDNFYLNIQTIATIGKAITASQPSDQFDIRLPENKLKELMKTIEVV